MFGFLKKLLGNNGTSPLQDYLSRNALVLDVRTPQEFAGGHVSGSVNVPVAQLPGGLKKLKDKSQPIITCCASGGRSANAAAMLRKAGYKQVINGGPWTRVRRAMGE
jgi:rhodanese-related sulfurtransferase